MSFGQTLTITPIQLVAAISAIANDGIYMQPRLAKEIRAPDGSVRMRMEPRALRQVISKDTAKELKTALQLAVEQGTGRRAYVEGYNVAGKTGTAQKAVGGRIAEGRYVASFVGFAPVDKPQVVTLVMLDEPSGSYYGGTVAAPVFAAVMKDVLHYLEVPPDRAPRSARPEDQEAPEDLVVPDLMNLTPAEATEVCSAAGLSLRVEGSGVAITSQLPAPGAVMPAGAVVLAYTDEKEMTRSGLVRVPSVEGKSLRQAAERLAAAGLVLEPIGTGLAKEQYPAAGTQVSPGHTVTVVFEAPGEPVEP